MERALFSLVVLKFNKKRIEIYMKNNKIKINTKRILIKKRNITLNLYIPKVFIISLLV
jgi:hypothetical protein